MASRTVPARVLPPAAPPARIALELLAATVVAVVVNALVYLVGCLGVGRAYDPAQPLVLTVLGVLVGVVGWVIVRRFVPRPAAVLRVLVPLVVLASLYPDVVLFGRVGVVMVVALMVMHVVVAVPTVIALRRVLPVEATAIDQG